MYQRGQQRELARAWNSFRWEDGVGAAIGRCGYNMHYTIVNVDNCAARTTPLRAAQSYEIPAGAVRCSKVVRPDSHLSQYSNWLLFAIFLLLGLLIMDVECGLYDSVRVWDVALF